MPVVRYGDIEFTPVNMEGVSEVSKANVVCAREGWKDGCLRVFRIGPGGFTPHHQHDWEHVNYIIKGRGQLTLGGETKEVAAGDFAFVPPNTEHQFENPFDEVFEFICVVPPEGA